MLEKGIDFKYQNYRLRKPGNKDIQGLISITNNLKIMKYYGTTGSFLKTEEQAINQITWMNDCFTKNIGRWVIVEDESDSYIGDIGFMDYDDCHHKIEIGSKIEEKYWGKGIISYFTEVLVDYAFENFNVNRIESYIDERNIPAKKVIAKCGFQYEGTLREYEFENEEYVNIEIHSFIRGDLTRKNHT